MSHGQLIDAFPYEIISVAERRGQIRAAGGGESAGETGMLMCDDKRSVHYRAGTIV